MRNNNKFFQKFAAAIVQRSGIARPTVEALLPHVFDEIRYILTEGNGDVAIEGFGTFHVKDKPEHEYFYNYKGVGEVRTVKAKKQIKFAPARNLTDEMNRGQYDAARHSFTRMPGDPMLRHRSDMRYKKVKNYSREGGASARPIYKRNDPVPVERKSPNCLPANSTEDEEKH